MNQIKGIRIPLSEDSTEEQEQEVLAATAASLGEMFSKIFGDRVVWEVFIETEFFSGELSNMLEEEQGTLH